MANNYPAPRWEDAPYWANYLVFDDHGVPFWHQHKPTSNTTGWTSDGRIECACIYGWSSFIDKRPEVIQKMEDDIEDYANFKPKNLPSSLSEKIREMRQEYGHWFDYYDVIDIENK